jgi:hypothetical protein
MNGIWKWVIITYHYFLKCHLLTKITVWRTLICITTFNLLDKTLRLFLVLFQKDNNYQDPNWVQAYSVSKKLLILFYRHIDRQHKGLGLPRSTVPDTEWIQNGSPSRNRCGIPLSMWGMLENARQVVSVPAKRGMFTETFRQHTENWGRRLGRGNAHHGQVYIWLQLTKDMRLKKVWN